jgi:hypothetical protein
MKLYIGNKNYSSWSMRPLVLLTQAGIPFDVAMRIRTYGLPVPAPVSAWIARLVELPGVAAWIRDALAEKDFVQFEEPYRSGEAQA